MIVVSTFLFVVMCSIFFCVSLCFVFFFKQKTAYEMRISDWSSDVCSSDLFPLNGWSGSMSCQMIPCSLKNFFVALKIGSRRFARWSRRIRSEEHTSELQSLMRISYAVFCLKQKISYIITHFRSFIITTHKTVS